MLLSQMFVVGSCCIHKVVLVRKPLTMSIYYSICIRATFVMILTLLMKYCQEWSIYLVYIYNSFVFNSFLTFLLSLTFVYVLRRFKLVLRHFRGMIKELYRSGNTFLPWHAEEPNVAKQLVWRIFTSWFATYCISIYTGFSDLI